MYTGITVGSQEVVTLAQNSEKSSLSIYKMDKSEGFAGMLFTITAVQSRWSSNVDFLLPVCSILQKIIPIARLAWYVQLLPRGRIMFNMILY